MATLVHVVCDQLGLTAYPKTSGATGMQIYVPIEPGPTSFVLADSLAFCRFSYLAPAAPPMPAPQWVGVWMLPKWPMAVRVEMAPFGDNAARLRPVTVTQRIRINRSPEIEYVDE